MKPNVFDWLVYKLFYWRWNVILAANPGMLKLFRLYLDSWDFRYTKVLPHGKTLNGELED